MLLAAKNKPSNWRRVRYLDEPAPIKGSVSGGIPGKAAKGGGDKEGAVRFEALAESKAAADQDSASEDEVDKALAHPHSRSPPARVPGRSVAKRGSGVNGGLLAELEEKENDPHK